MYFSLECDLIVPEEGNVMQIFMCIISVRV